jgi:hypothetical protein
VSIAKILEKEENYKEDLINYLKDYQDIRTVLQTFLHPTILCKRMRMRRNYGRLPNRYRCAMCNLISLCQKVRVILDYL